MMDWWYDFPSHTVRWKIEHKDQDRLRGNALSLLRLVKERMKTRSLHQLRSVRVFNTGEVILVESVCGMDYISISGGPLAGARKDVRETCSITFIDLPAAVQPMRNPGVIDPGEVEGVDYIKTYYSMTSECPSCSPMEWKVEFLYSASDAEPNVVLVMNLSVVDTDHCEISMDGGCHAEIIEQGSDDGGTYILWKAYTEIGTYSRSGLGVLLISATMGSGSNPLLCKAASPVEVDCCLKEKDARQVKIYWEECTAGVDEIVVWGGVELCVVPDTVCQPELLTYVGEDKVFYVLPDIDGGCLPFVWTATLAEINAPYPGLYASVTPGDGPTIGTITAKDRCGTEAFAGVACCDCPDYAGPSILYDLLTMGCDTTQTFTATGGCPPYTWAVEGGCGTLGDPYGDNNKYVDYTSPETNPDCDCQPVIVLLDKCETETSLSFAVSCGGYIDTPALKLCLLVITNAHKPSKVDCGGTQCCHGTYTIDTWNWECDGSLYNECHYSAEVGCWYFDCAVPNTEEGSCSNAGILDWMHQYNVLGVPPDQCSGCACGVGDKWNCYLDLRSEAMIDNGCCPIGT